MISKRTIQRELAKINALKKKDQGSDWQFIGGVQQALSWVLQNNAMKPSRVVSLKGYK